MLLQPFNLCVWRELIEEIATARHADVKIFEGPVLVLV